MNICLVASTDDLASMNMQEFCVKRLLEDGDFLGRPVFSGTVGRHNITLVTHTARSVAVNQFDEKLKPLCNPEIIVFLSKHASVSGIPSLCIHTQGNWGKADLGGNPSEIGVTPVVLKNLLYSEMHSQNNTEFDVVQEATHHGPSLKTPAIFFEIGSTQKEWVDSSLGEFMVTVLWSVLESYIGETSELPVIFGIGGSHTCSNYNRLSYEGKVLLGHICPNYALGDLSVEMVSQALDRSTLPCEIVVDWKSLNSAQRTAVSEVLEGREWSKLKELKKRVD